MAFNHTLTETLVQIEELHWFYIGRRELLNSLLDRFVRQDLSFTLDLGCSSGSNLGVLQMRSSTVVGFDLSRSALAISSGTLGATLSAASRAFSDIPAMVAANAMKW